MNQYSIESFNQWCDNVTIAEEGKILDAIKRVINNTINKKLNNGREISTTKDDGTSSTSSYVSFTAKKATASDFDMLYKEEAYCAEGLANADSESVHKAFAKVISSWKGCPEEIHLFYCTGKDLNKYYHLTGDNKYDDRLGVFFIDWSNFSKDFDAAGHKGKFRYFSDVVDNNARREIQKGNPHYKGYHSLYGDSWFYSTI